MPISAASAARTACVAGNWSLSGLSIQRALYLAHRGHLAVKGAPLIEEEFQATMFGPILLSIRPALLRYGAGPVRSGFRRAALAPEGSSERTAIEQAVHVTTKVRSGQLVADTMRPDGAWARFYHARIEAIRIPHDAVREEGVSLRARKERR